jgi:GxxExxY protein
VNIIHEPSPELDALARETIGAAIEVHRALGPGFLESVYEEALCLELTHRNISFGRQVPIPICYRSRPVGTSQLDLMVGGQLVVELKAVPQILPIHVAQVISYLKAARKPLGLLLNFHVPVLQAGIKRVVLSKETHRGTNQRGAPAGT